MRDQELWDRISNHRFDEEGVALPFSVRLARDMSWSESFAAGAIQEYRHFVYLCCISENLTTPSEEVDEVWHLHLAYTRDYWEEFCPNVLRRPLHHGPTKGGLEERMKYRSAYENTLWLYEQEFEIEPPAIYWPQANVRFSASRVNRRIDRARFFIVPRRMLYGAIIAGVIGSLLVAFVDWDILLSIAIAALVIVVIGFINRLLGPIGMRMNKWPEREGNNAIGWGGCSGCGGGSDGGCGA